MVYKRPFHDESYEVGCKHPRQQGYTAPQSPIGGIARCSDSPQKLASDEGENSARKSNDEGRIAGEMVSEVSEDLNEANMELKINDFGSISSYLWVNGNAIDEYAESEAAVHLSLFPHYFELDHRATALVQPHDIYSVLLDHPPKKLVSVGPDHQADVPEWVPQGSSKSSVRLDKSEAHIILAQFSGSGIVDDDDNEAKLLGTCAIPMPDMESSAYNCCMGGGTRSFCNCLDRGSVGCVRQHVMEAREELRENLGQKIFEELGFCDMGEEVAKKWLEEEEQTFHEVVFSNAASLGKNIWECLSATFPSRAKKDLVSYYFNVFMLRKRAEQNRFDPLNIDSDNDEWQRSELGMTEEDDDSVVESLDQAPAHNQENREEELLEGIEEEKGDLDDVSAALVGEKVGACGLDLSGKFSSNNGEDHDIQDDSCTSYEYQSDKFDSCGPVDLRTVLENRDKNDCSRQLQATSQDP